MPSTLARLALVLLLSLTMGFEWPGRLHRLRHDLDRGDATVRREAARELANYPTADVAEALLGALEDPDAGVRLAAASSAGQVRLRPAVPILIDWLDERDPAVRAAAARALGHVGEKRATAPLVRLLGDARAEVRRAAVAALARVGDPEAVEPMLGRLDEPDVSVRVEVIDALARLGDARAVVPLLAQADAGAQEVQLATLGALSALGDARALPSLLQALSSERAPLRFAAIAAIGKLRLPDASDALVQRLSLPDTRQAKALISALGAIATPSGLAAVVEQLPSEGRHAAAVQALVNAAARGNEPAEPPAPQSVDATAEAAAVPDESQVVKLLVDALSRARDATQADAFARALSRVSEVSPIASATPPLLEALSRAGHQRAGLLSALARTRAPEALEPLLQQLTQPKDVPASAALAALTTYFDHVAIDARAADPLLAVLPQAQGDDRVGVVRLLGHSGAPHAVEVLSPMATGDNEAVRHAALEALGRIGGKAAQTTLLSMLGHRSGETRLIAAEGLGACGSTVAARALLERLIDDAPLDRHAALIALGPILGRLQRGKGVHEALAEVTTDVVRELAHQGDATLASRAIDLLTHWHHDGGLQLLTPFLRSPSHSVRMHATRAVGRFAGDEARGLIRYLLFRSSTKVAASAVGAMGEIGDRRDIPHLMRVVARRHWPLQGVAAFSIYRMAQRNVVRPRSTARTLCKLGESREPYLRANVAAALATLGMGACEDGGPSPIDWLQPDHATAVRVAAAHWLRRGAAEGRIDAQQAARALRRCQQRDLDADVARVCGSTVAPPPEVEPLDLYAYAADGRTLLRDRLVAVRFIDGSVLLGHTDGNGHITAPAVPAGRVVLEDPSQLPLEAH